ncbi:MAG: T9SS C-terminal target domain-containing protein [Flavobacteriales bacterium]|nr:MAG: T9SS C-terminal target domain-containing protein [Flavobacteriales bacterium]
MTNKPYYLTILSLFFAAAVNAQSLTVSGGTVSLANNTMLYTPGLSVTSGTFECAGHLIIDGSLTGSANIDLASTANLDLRQDAEFVFSDDASFWALDLANTARVIVQPGKSIELEGSIVHNSSENIELRADATNGYSMLKNSGPYSGSGTGRVMQQQNLNAGWIMIAAPMTNTTAGFFGDVGATGPGHTVNTQNLFSWDGSNYVNVVDNNSTITPGRGYFGFVGQYGFRGTVGVHDFTGVPNLSVSPSLNFATAGNDVVIEGDPTATEGWNLIANPFTCALDFSLLTRTNVDNAFYVFNNSKSGGAGYESYASGGISHPEIAPLQSFWVKASAASPSLGTLSMATHGTTSASPNHLRTVSFDRLVLRTHVAQDTAINDYTVVSFVDDNTTMGYDGAWDAYKMANTGSIPNIYSTHSDGAAMAINAIPYGPGYSDKMTVPISFRASQQGESFRISFDDSYMLNTYAVYLEDKLEKTFTDLNAQDYSFVNDTSMSARFVLHFRAGALSIDEPESLSRTNTGLHAWIFAGQAHINSRIAGDVQLSVFDMSGKQLQSGQMNVSAGGRYEWPLRQDLAAGVYLLRIHTSLGTQSIKFNK